MPKMIRILPVLALGLVACNLALGPGAASADDTNADARKARILANLQVQFPQLKDMSPVMGEIKASGIAGLDQGSFIVGGRQTQAFLVTADNKRFWMVSGEPLDVIEERRRNQDRARRPREGRSRRSRQEGPETCRTPSPASPSAAPPTPDHRGRVLGLPVSLLLARRADHGSRCSQKHPKDVKFVFKHFPLNFHPWAMPAAIAAKCAADQKPEAFWTLHDAYFKNQKDLNPANLADKTREYLAGSGVDMAKFVACAEDKDSEEYKKAAQSVNADMSLGGRLGVTGTPGFFVNGHFLNGAMPIEQFEEAMAKAKAN